MSALFDDPMVQAGVAPFTVALLVALLLMRVRAAALPWLALAAGLAATLALTTGIGFTPLSASRKVLLLVLLAPFVGLVLDLAGVRHRLAPALLALAAAAASVWVFQSVLAQAEGAQRWISGGGVALFVAATVLLLLRLRDDGVATAAATVGLGVAVGVCALLAASIGTLTNGIALAAAGGALLLLQFVLARPLAAGFTGALGVGMAASLMPAGTFMLADLRWPALLLLPAVPLVAGLPLFGASAPRLRTALRGITAGAAALLPIGITWFLSAGSAT